MYTVYFTGTNGDMIDKQMELDTVIRMFGDMIKTINYDSMTVFVDLV